MRRNNTVRQFGNITEKNLTENGRTNRWTLLQTYDRGTWWAEALCDPWLWCPRLRVNMFIQDLEKKTYNAKSKPTKDKE